MGTTASRRGGSSTSMSASAIRVVLIQGRHDRLPRVGGVVAAVEEGVLAQADVDEGRLHPGQHVGDHALVDAAHDRPPVVPLDEQLGEEITLLDRDPGFGEFRVDDDPFAHGSTSLTRGHRPRRRTGRASHWNCRIRTESRSPTA